MDCRQLKDYVIKPALSAIGLYSESAVNLLMLTAATESQLGKYIRQRNVPDRVGAYSIFQIEESTYNDVWHRSIDPNVAMKAKVRIFLGYDVKPPVYRLMTDLSLSAIIARLFYYRIPEPLPLADDHNSLAAFYKKFYNTNYGSNTVSNALNDYRKYCGVLYVEPSLL